MKLEITEKEKTILLAILSQEERTLGEDYEITADDYYAELQADVSVLFGKVFRA